MTQHSTPIIPIDAFFTNPSRERPIVSPDGKHLAYLAQGSNKNLQVFVQPLDAFFAGKDDPAPRQVTNHKTHDIRWYQWSKDSQQILYAQDHEGDEKDHLFGVDLASSNVRDYTPFEGVRVEYGWGEMTKLRQVATKPNEGLLMLNVRDRTQYDVWHLDLATGALTMRHQSPGNVIAFYTNKNLEVCAYVKTTAEGDYELRVRPEGDAANAPLDEWKALLHMPNGHVMRVHDLSESGRFMYLSHPLDRDAKATFELDLTTGEQKLIAESDVDILMAMTHPQAGYVQAVMSMPGRHQWQVVDDDVRADFDKLRAIDEEADYTITDQSDDNNTWIVRSIRGDAPASYYLYDRTTKEARFLFSTNKDLAQYKLGRMESVHYPARDGLPLQGYLTYPPDFVPTQKYPLVLYVHGGPWHRDVYDCSPTAQWLANRGYVVLQPNYRGSTDFNKRHLMSSFKQWGKAMHDDLIDSVEMAVQRGFVDRDNVAVFGGSYGGYAALCAVTLTPEYFTCAVDIVGPSNLRTLLGSIPPYWKPMLATMHTRMGNPEHDAELMDSVSPLTHAHKIVRPLIIAQGKNDPRVKEAESEQIVQAIERNGGSVYYVLYPDEGHGFKRPVNRLDFYSKAELFLHNAMHKTARCQKGLSLDTNYEGSSAIVRVIGKL
ncbi:hypothetical protein RI367_006281 [Sorochytrium milnesiophthora]